MNSVPDLNPAKRKVWRKPYIYLSLPYIFVYIYPYWCVAGSVKSFLFIYLFFLTVLGFLHLFL